MDRMLPRFRRLMHSANIQRINNIIEEKMVEYLINSKKIKINSPSYWIDCSKSMTLLYKKYQKYCEKTDFNYFKAFNLKELTDITQYNVKSDASWVYHKELPDELMKFFTAQKSEYYNMLYYIHNADYFWKRILDDKMELIMNPICKDNENCVKATLQLKGKTYKSIDSDSIRALQKLTLYDDVYEYLCTTAFALTNDNVDEIYSKKMRGEVTNFCIDAETVRLLILQGTDNYGFTLCGGELICTSDHVFVEKYRFSPVFIESVIDNSIAAQSGLRSGDEILAINFTDINGLDIDVVSHILKRAIVEGGIALSVRNSKENYELYKKLIEFYKTKQLNFDPEPKSDHPSLLARRSKRPLYRMSHHKKLLTQTPT